MQSTKAVWQHMQAAAEEKKKAYRCLVWSHKALTKDSLKRAVDNAIAGGAGSSTPVVSAVAESGSSPPAAAGGAAVPTEGLELLTHDTPGAGSLPKHSRAASDLKDDSDDDDEEDDDIESSSEPHLQVCSGRPRSIFEVQLSY